MQSNKIFEVLFLGDVVGRPGRLHVKKFLADELSGETRPDLIIVNGENAAHGFGLTEKIVNEFIESGVDIISGGNHTFDKKEIFEFIDKYPFVLRPANYPPETPGKGTYIFESDGYKVAVVNLMGRVFMEALDSPFRVADGIIESLDGKADSIIVDLHAEATAEKVAMALHLDGRVAAVLGTHTHVQTADERILAGGTAYITDAGMCGPRDGVIGMDKVLVFRRLIDQLPTRFEIAGGASILNGVRFKIDRQTGKAVSIERIAQVQEN